MTELMGRGNREREREGEADGNSGSMEDSEVGADEESRPKSSRCSELPNYTLLREKERSFFGAPPYTLCTELAVCPHFASLGCSA